MNSTHVKFHMRCCNICKLREPEHDFWQNYFVLNLCQRPSTLLHCLETQTKRWRIVNDDEDNKKRWEFRVSMESRRVEKEGDEKIVVGLLHFDTIVAIVVDISWYIYNRVLIIWTVWKWKIANVTIVQSCSAITCSKLLNDFICKFSKRTCLYSNG